MHRIFSLLAVLFCGMAQAQELNCTVTVNADQVGLTNQQVFKTLEKSLSDFVNKTDWTGQGYKPNERISCSMFINVTAYNSSSFTATIQVQGSRPVYNSTYSTTFLNFNDKDFSFDYTEFQNLNFNPTAFESNLISVVAFYSFMIIGMDADTFSPEGGSAYLETAQDIANVAQGSGYKGWAASDGNSNRYYLINDMLAPTYAPFRQVMYKYHFEGMDQMARDPKAAKAAIAEAVGQMMEVHSVRPNAFLTRVFFDAKADEIVSVFSGGPKVSISELVDTLNRVSPLNAAKWATIKF